MGYGNSKGHEKMVLLQPIRRGPEKVAWGLDGRTGRARLSARFCSLPRLLGHSWLTLTVDHKLCSRVSPQRRLQNVIVRSVGLGPKRWLLEEGQAWDRPTGRGNM